MNAFKIMSVYKPLLYIFLVISDNPQGLEGDKIFKIYQSKFKKMLKNFNVLIHGILAPKKKQF